MKKNVTIFTFLFIFCSLIVWAGCRKMDTGDNKQSEEAMSAASLVTACEDISSPKNQLLLELVLTGSGGSFESDSGLIEFPAYTPPTNTNGMLSFASMDDYNKFMTATYLMEDYWEYSDIDYEETPEEIEHLGEEPLNALDCALSFQSLRYQYEINDFYDDNWEDTMVINVDDFDYQVVLNTDNEVKIGNKYYKYLANNIIAVIDNDNINAVELLRRYGFFANDADISFYNEETGEPVNPPAIDGTAQTQGCNNFDIYAFANNLTPSSSTVNQWTVELSFSCYYNVGLYQVSPSVLGDYTIDWGDGTVESFRDRFEGPSRKIHMYSQTLAPGTSVQKQITVTCRIVNPDAQVLFYCPTISSILLSQSTFVTLSTPAPQNCLWGTHKRKFDGQQQSVNGNNYRLECKLIHKSNPVFGFPHIKAKATFRKRRSNGA